MSFDNEFKHSIDEEEKILRVPSSESETSVISNFTDLSLKPHLDDQVESTNCGEAFHGRSQSYFESKHSQGDAEVRSRHRRRASCPDLKSMVSSKRERRKSASFRKKSFANLKIDMNVALKDSDSLSVGTHNGSRVPEPREQVVDGNGTRSRRHCLTVISNADDEECKGSSRHSEPNSTPYEVTETGEFNIQGFSISNCGIVQTPTGKHRSYPHKARGTSIDDALAKVRQLGKGSSGTVTKMIHIPTLKLVAVKTITCFDQAHRDEVLRELKTLNQNIVPIEDDALEHKEQETHCDYIVSFYNAFTTHSGDSISFVEEYMNGGTLQNVLDRGGCDCEVTLATIARSLLKGLAFLHGRGQIHRDIKPSNILINRRGDVKISDFGISVQVDKKDPFASKFVGTLLFMSPERILSHDYSYNADVWSLGITILSVALGQIPFQSENGYWGMVKRIGEGVPPKFPEGSKFSDTMRDFVAQCLIKDPKERPNARDLLSHPLFQICMDERDTVDHLTLATRQRTQKDKAGDIHQVVEALVHYHEEALNANTSAKSDYSSPARIPNISRDKIGRLAYQLDCDEEALHCELSNTINKANGRLLRSQQVRSPMHVRSPLHRHQSRELRGETASAV